MKRLLSTIAILGAITTGAQAEVDQNKYYQCYAEMTRAHKASGLHYNNRSMSIEVKEKICKARAQR